MGRIGGFAAVAGLCLATCSAASALDRNGYYDASDNPLLGSWLLSEEGINPNFPVRCGIDRLMFAPTTSDSFTDGGGHFHGAAQYVPRGPRTVSVISDGIRTYILADRDHIVQDEIPRCTWRRGPLNGTTPLLDSKHAEAAAKRLAEAPGGPPPVMSYEDAIDAIDKLGK